MSKNYRRMVFGAFLVLLLCGGVIFMNLPGSLVAADQETAKGKLSVSGQGRASAKPDMAYITVGVQTEAKTARETQSENNEQIEKVIAALKGTGIGEDDIRTVNYDLSPRYDYLDLKNGRGKQVLAGYTAVHQVRVTVRDLKAVGKALDSVVNAGANLTGGVVFTLSEAKMEAAYAEALESALKNARGKAEVLAKGLGLILGKPQEVNESGGNPVPVYERDYAGAAMKAGAVPISAGQLEVTATVNLRYEY